MIFYYLFSINLYLKYIFRRENDWTCKDCNVNVYGSRDSCFKCRKPKSEVEKPGGGGGSSFGNSRYFYL